jgi:hypothetical protein
MIRWPAAGDWYHICCLPYAHPAHRPPRRDTAEKARQVKAAGKIGDASYHKLLFVTGPRTSRAVNLMGVLSLLHHSAWRQRLFALFVGSRCLYVDEATESPQARRPERKRDATR